jgi:disulfide bond formation protein DsbB
MKILLGGIAALVLGVIGLIIWFFDFLMILKGLVPIALILGGALAIYLGIEDVKTSASAEEETPPPPSTGKETKE